MRYQEFSNLDHDVPVVPADDGFACSPGSAGSDWADGLISEGATILLGYDHPHLGQFPAVVTHRHHAGRITTVGTLPNPVLAHDLLSWLVPTRPWTGLPPSVTAHSATNAAGRRIHVVHNWSWTPQRVGLPQPMSDLLATDTGTLDNVDLGPWDVRVLAE